LGSLIFFCSEKPKNDFVIYLNDSIGVKYDLAKARLRNSKFYKNKELLTIDNLRQFLLDQYGFKLYLLAEGYKNGLDKDPGFKTALKDRINQSYLMYVNKIFKIDKFKVDEVDSNYVRDVYNLLGKKVKVDFMRFYSKDLADSVYNLVKSNKISFDSAMGRFYPYGLKIKGKTFFVGFFDYPDSVWKIIVHSKAKEVLKPVKMRSSYFVFRIDTVAKAKIGNYDNIKKELTKRIASKLGRFKFESYMDSIIANTKIAFNEKLIKMFFDDFNKLTTEYKDSCMAVFEGNCITYTDIFSRVSPFSVKIVDNIKLAIVDRVIDYVMIDVIKKYLHPEEDSIFKKRLERIKTDELIRYTNYKLIESKVNQYIVTDMDAKNFYEKHKNDYKTGFEVNKNTIKHRIQKEYYRSLHNQFVSDCEKKYKIKINVKLLKSIINELK